MRIFYVIFYVICLMVLSSIPCFADNDNMTIFPIEHYSQEVNQWLNASEPQYQKNLLEKNYQAKRFQELLHTYFGTGVNDNALWSETYINYLLKYNQDLTGLIIQTLQRFDNRYQSGKTVVFGMNYRAYSHQWLVNIQKNIHLANFNALHYLAENRAIATQNLPLRFIPTDDPGYYSTRIAGEGYPFDNIQASAVQVGTPLYIVGTTSDKAWSLVMTPECIGWMRSSGVARVNNAFIQQWQRAAYAGLIGFKKTMVSVMNAASQYQFSAYIGMMFPKASQNNTKTTLLIPIKKADGSASIEKGVVDSNDTVLLPWLASPEHFADIFRVLKGREYGWGSADFYTDCSAEMKAIFSLFGIFMPRNTQRQGLAGYVVDISNLSPEMRSQYLINRGVPLLTLVHVKGHILLYVGAYKDRKGNPFPLSYQQVWSLYPKDKSSRSVIGKAVFLPLLTHYPEDAHLAPQLDNEVFELVYLNRFPTKPLKQHLTM